MPRHNFTAMPPTEVRPQTFDPLQSPDSASPSVRSQTRLSTCCLDILPSLAFQTRTLYIQFSRCIVPMAWFSLFGTKILSHSLKPMSLKTRHTFLRPLFLGGNLRESVPPEATSEKQRPQRNALTERRSISEETSDLRSSPISKSEATSDLRAVLHLICKLRPSIPPKAERASEVNSPRKCRTAKTSTVLARRASPWRPRASLLFAALDKSASFVAGVSCSEVR